MRFASLAGLAAAFIMVGSTASVASAQVKFCGKTWPLNAKKLVCRYGADTNLIALRSLTDLEEVVLASGRADNLMPLIHLPQLKRLTLEKYTLPDDALKVLARLSKLESLDLTGTHLKSAKQFAFLVQLKRLDISDTGLKSIKLLGGMHNLEHLALKGLKGLEGLEILAKLTKLTTLDLSETGAKTKKLGFLKNLEHLVDLTLPDETDDLKLLAKMTKLRRLVVRRTGVKDIKVLGTLIELRDLILDFAPAITDFKPLSALTKMQRLEVNGAEVGNMRWMLPMKGLQILNLRNARMVGALPQVGQMKNLRFLSLASTNTSNIDSLRLLKKLELLDLSGTHVTKLKALNGLEKLRKLDLSNTNVERGEVERIKRVLKGVKVRYDLFLQ